jgi:hypothetical protein
MIEGVNEQPGKVAATSKNAKNREGNKTEGANDEGIK